MPCLGSVPSVSTLKRGQTLLHCLCSKPWAPYYHSVHALNAQLTIADPPPKVILVTSALPKEGKTSLAAALAVCAAQSGIEKTILVDFDLWCPKVARHFGLKSVFGVAELIAHDGEDQQQRLEQAVIIDQTSGIDILPAGRRSDGAAMTPQRIYTLLDKLRQRYDRIIIDSPPLLGVSDGRILSTFADATIFAIRWGHTDLDAAAAGVKILRDMLANIFGAVLTRVDPKKQVRFGEGDPLQFLPSLQKYYGRSGQLPAP